MADEIYEGDTRGGCKGQHLRRGGVAETWAAAGRGNALPPLAENPRVRDRHVAFPRQASEQRPAAQGTKEGALARDPCVADARAAAEVPPPAESAARIGAGIPLRGRRLSGGGSVARERHRPSRRSQERKLAGRQAGEPELLLPQLSQPDSQLLREQGLCRADEQGEVVSLLPEEEERPRGG